MMKQIFRIALKDFQIQLKSILNYIIVGLVLILVFSLINLSQKQMVYAISGFAIIYGFVNKALYEDERNNTLRLLASMPVKRDVIVYARYLSTGVFIISLSLVMSLFAAFSNWTAHAAGEETAAAVLIVMTTFMLFAIMLSIYLPLAFKLGYIKAAGINRFIFLGIFAFFGAVSVVLSGVEKNKSSELPLKLEGYLSSMDPAMLLACIVIFVLIIYMVSMRISIKLFRKRVLF